MPSPRLPFAIPSIPVSIAVAAACAAACAALAGAATAQQTPQERTPAEQSAKTLARWQPYQDGKLPEPAELPGLLRELTELLGHQNPKLRDDLAYMQLARWILPPRRPADASSEQHQAKPVATDAHCIPLLDAWQGNLVHGLQPAQARQPAEPALRRSFSALSLALLVARDNRRPFLEPAAVQRLVTNTTRYLATEPDERGFVEALGWVHASAHAADLLWHLARNRHLTVAQQAEVLGAIRTRLQRCQLAFAAGEDDRLARAAFALTQRQDFDLAGFESWLRSWRRAQPFEQTARSITFAHNRRILMQSLYARLSLQQGEPANAAKARDLVARLLGGKL